MVESYIIDKQRGICPVEFSDIEDGSWAVSFKIENQSLWEQIINGNDLNGFSISAMVNLGFEKFEEEKPVENAIDELIKNLLS